MLAVRPPAVAGLFYPAEPHALARMVDGFLAAGSTLDAARPDRPAGSGGRNGDRGLRAG